MKKTRVFHDNESENISGESEFLCRCGTIYSFFLVIRNSSNKRYIGGAALIRGRRLLTFLSQMPPERAEGVGGGGTAIYELCRYVPL